MQDSQLRALANTCQDGQDSVEIAEPTARCRETPHSAGRDRHTRQENAADVVGKSSPDGGRLFRYVIFSTSLNNVLSSLFQAWRTKR